MTKIMVNNVLRDMTSEEETELTTTRAEQATKREAEATAKTAQDTTKASGNTKLLDLGLTQAEATALTGYVPPAEV